MRNWHLDLEKQIWLTEKELRDHLWDEFILRKYYRKGKKNGFICFPTVKL